MWIVQSLQEVSLPDDVVLQWKYRFRVPSELRFFYEICVGGLCDRVSLATKCEVLTCKVSTLRQMNTSGCGVVISKIEFQVNVDIPIFYVRPCACVFLMFPSIVCILCTFQFPLYRR
jgi:hypothetical protein